SYTIQATTGGLDTATSPQFDVTNQLVVTTAPPDSVTAGAGFGLTVKVEDGLGNVITSYNGPVTLSASDKDHQSLPMTGTLRVQAVNGVATFSGVGLTQALDTTLTASAPDLATTTASITVNAAAATQLVFSGPPSAVAPNDTFSLS